MTRLGSSLGGRGGSTDRNALVVVDAVPGVLRVREAEPSDAAAVCRVHEAAIRGLGPRGYDDDQVDAWAGDRSPADYDFDTEDYDVVADRDGEVVGFGTLVPERPDYLTDRGDSPAGAVEAVYVHPDHAGEGVGSAILADLEREARDRGLASLGLQASLNAVEFYERRGYEREREVSHAFGGDDCEVRGTVVEMWRHLGDDD